MEMPYHDMYIEGRNVTRIVKALSSDVRLKILELLDAEERNIQSIATKLGLSKTTVLNHVHILEEAGFLATRYVPGTVGNQRMCRKVYDRLIYNFTPHQPNGQWGCVYEIATPVGNYFDFEVYPPCGLASKSNVIKKWDDPFVFCDVERVEASLVWSAFGFIEYKIPIGKPLAVEDIAKIEILLEVSAQGEILNHDVSLPDYLKPEDITDGVSDITFWINQVEVGTLTFQEYSRGSGGKYTPKWWRGSHYGLLVQIAITPDRISLNEQVQTNKTIRDIGLREYINLRVGLKRDAKNISGFNIYGRDFGNTPYDIVTRVY